MKKQITIIAMAIIMLAGAMAMSGGESINFKTNLTDPYYTVTGNSSSLEGLNVTLDGGNITISVPLDYASDSFTLIFFDKVTNEVERIIHTSGGTKTKTKYVDNNVTIYVPEYIDNNETIEVEVENLVEKIIYTDEGYKLWHLILLGLVSLVFGAWMVSSQKKQDEETSENAK